LEYLELRTRRIDCFHAVSGHRFAQVLDSARLSRQHDENDVNDDNASSNFAQYHCLTLPHFMALIGRPTKDSIKTNVSLVVVSSLTALINSSLPKPNNGLAPIKGPKGAYPVYTRRSIGFDHAAVGSTPTAKRLQVLQYIITALQKLAATRTCAVVLLSQCATRMHSEQSAALVPAVNATVWESGISTRIAVYKDWVWQGGQLRSASMLQVQKLDGKTLHDGADHLSAFAVKRVCAQGLEADDDD
jgi:hypothetical protein